MLKRCELVKNRLSETHKNTDRATFTWSCFSLHPCAYSVFTCIFTNVLDYSGTLFLTKHNIFNGTWSMLYKVVMQKCNQCLSIYVKWIYSWSQVMVSKRKPKLGFCVLWLCFKPLKQLVYFRWRLCFLPPSLVKGNVRGDCLSPARQVVEYSLKDLVRGGGSWANGGRLGLAQAHGPESRPTTKSKDKSRSCKMSSQTFKTQMCVVAVDLCDFEREVVGNVRSGIIRECWEYWEELKFRIWKPGLSSSPMLHWLCDFGQVGSPLAFQFSHLCNEKTYSQAYHQDKWGKVCKIAL